MDIVLDPLGTAALDADLAVIAPGGRIVLFGSAGGAELAPLPPVARLYSGNIAIGGISMRRLCATAPHRVSAGLRHVLAVLAEGRLDIPITEVDALADVPAIHRLLAEGRSEGKYVVRLWA